MSLNDVNAVRDAKVGQSRDNGILSQALGAAAREAYEGAGASTVRSMDGDAFSKARAIDPVQANAATDKIGAPKGQDLAPANVIASDTAYDPRLAMAADEKFAQMVNGSDNKAQV